MTTYNLEEVLDGDVFQFIERLLQEEQAAKLESFED